MSNKKTKQVKNQCEAETKFTKETGKFKKVKNSSKHDEVNPEENKPRTQEQEFAPEGLIAIDLEENLQPTKWGSEKVKTDFVYRSIETPNVCEPELSKELEKTIHEECSFSNIMTYAKEQVSKDKNNIQKHIDNMVALYNIGDKKAFYFITSQEARLAIEYVNEIRTGKKQEIQNKKDMDEKIDKFATTFDFKNFKPQYDISELDAESVMPIIHRIEDNHADYSTFNHPLMVDMDQGLDDRFLSLNLLNKAFGVLEGYDLVVDAIIVNSFLFTHIRNFGLSVYDYHENKEVHERKKIKSSAIGSIFTAEIYRCNELKEGQFVLYNREIEGYFLFSI